MTTVQERKNGAFWGAVVGDALGAPVEFLTAEYIARRYGRVVDMMSGGRWRRGEWTDDTALMLATMSAYRGDAFDFDTAVGAMIAWLKSEPKDVGKQTACTLRAIASGRVSATEAGFLFPDGAGNGSLMRALPTALVRPALDPRLREESELLSRVTHSDLRCVSACVAFNTIVSSLVHSGVTVPEAVGVAVAVPGIDMRILAVLIDVLQSRPLVYQNDPIGYVLLTFERAVRSVLDAASFETGLSDVVNAGGDTDTNGAVAGALLGARFGFDAIPRRWLDALHDRDGLRKCLETFEGKRRKTP